MVQDFILLPWKCFFFALMGFLKDKKYPTWSQAEKFILGNDITVHHLVLLPSAGARGGAAGGGGGGGGGGAPHHRVRGGGAAAAAGGGGQAPGLHLTPGRPGLASIHR